MRSKSKKIDEKYAQGASVVEMYQTAKGIISASGYKELASPLQKVLAGQLLEAAEQPEAAAVAYAKAKKEDASFAERFTEQPLVTKRKYHDIVTNKQTDLYSRSRGVKFDKDHDILIVNKKNLVIYTSCIQSVNNPKEFICLDDQDIHEIILGTEWEMISVKKICLADNEANRILIAFEISTPKSQEQKYIYYNDKKQYFYPKNKLNTIDIDNGACIGFIRETDIPKKMIFSSQSTY